MAKRKIIKFREQGFTLIELIIVIVFIGIFASVALTRTQLGLSVIQEQIAIDQITNDIDFARSISVVI